MLLQMTIFHSFLGLSNIPLCVYVYVCVCVCMSLCMHTHDLFLSHSSVDGHLDSFHILAIVNSAAMNIEVHVSFQIVEFFSDICSKVGLLDHMATLFLVF